MQKTEKKMKDSIQYWSISDKLFHDIQQIKAGPTTVLWLWPGGKGQYADERPR